MAFRKSHDSLKTQFSLFHNLLWSGQMLYQYNIWTASLLNIEYENDESDFLDHMA